MIIYTYKYILYFSHSPFSLIDYIIKFKLYFFRNWKMLEKWRFLLKKKNKKKIKWQKKSEVLLLTVCVKQHCEGEGEVRRRAGGRRRPCGPCHPYSPSHHGRTPEQSLNITGKNWTDQKTLTRSRVPSFVFLPSFHPHSYFFFFFPKLDPWIRNSNGTSSKTALC